MDFYLYIKGVLLILSVALMCHFSFLYFKASHFSKSLLCLLLGGATLRIWCLTDTFLYAWDERYHALVAKNLIANPLVPLLYKNPVLPYHYQQWMYTHVWLHKQPLSLWLMSLSLSIFGNVEWAVRLPSLLLSVACIYLTYRIARFFADEKTALIAAFFHAVNGLVIEIAAGRQSTDHVDNTFLFFIELSVYFTVLYAEKRKMWLLLSIGLATGLAILTKSFPALIVLPIFVVLTLKANEWIKTLMHCALILTVAFVVYAPWQLYIYHAFPQEATWENQYNLKHLTEAVEGHTGGIFWQLGHAVKVWNELIYVVFAWFAFHVFKNNNKKLLSLTIWLIIPYAFFSLVATKMIAYPLFTAPAVFIIEALFCCHFLAKPIKPLWANKLLITAIFFLAVRYGYERVKPFEPQLSDKNVAATIKNWRPIFEKNEKNVVFNAQNYVEIMFYFDNCVAYPSLSERKDMDSLRQLGYNIYIVKDAAIDTLKFANTNVHFLNIESKD